MKTFPIYSLSAPAFPISPSLAEFFDILLGYILLVLSHSNTLPTYLSVALLLLEEEEEEEEEEEDPFVRTKKPLPPKKRNQTTPSLSFSLSHLDIIHSTNVICNHLLA